MRMTTKRAIDEFKHWYDSGFSKSETPSSAALCWALACMEKQIVIEKVMNPTWDGEQGVEG